MYLVNFVANEPVYGSIEMNLESADTKEEATEMAEKEVRRIYPTHEDVVITELKDLA